MVSNMETTTTKTDLELVTRSLLDRVGLPTVEVVAVGAGHVTFELRCSLGGQRDIGAEVERAFGQAGLGLSWTGITEVGEMMPGVALTSRWYVASY